MSDDLPESWCSAVLGDIAEVRLGRQRSPDRAVGPHMRPYVRAANVTWNGVDVTDVKEMDFTPAEAGVFGLRDGDILVVEGSGSASEVGKPAIWRGEIEGCCFQNTLIRVRTAAKLVPWLHAHFRRDARQGRFAEASRGIGIHHIGAKALESWEISLPPAEEQARIVAKLDALQARADAAKEALDAIPPLLERFRQSVLAAAFRGDLTKAWREANPDVEPATQLLARIRAERRRKWEEANPRKQYVEPETADTANLPDLPEGWCWARWEEIGFCQNGRAFPSDQYTTGDGTRLLRPGNLHASGETDWNSENTRCLPDEWVRRYPTYVVGPHELVMNLTAQSLKDEFLGRVCLTAGTDRCLLNQRIARLTAVSGSPRFFLYLFKSPVFRRYVNGGLNTGSLIQHMFTSQVDNFVLPLPPEAEQASVVARIEDILATQRSTLSIARSWREAFASLNQSILAKAFRGELVPQDPNDEPASQLLERIRAERGAPSARPRRGRRSGTRG